MNGIQRHGHLRQLDRDVIRMTALLWAAHWGILVSRSAAVGAHSSLSDSAFTLAAIRLVVAVAGAASTLLIYSLLRGREIKPFRRLIVTLALATAAAIVLTLFNELLWMSTNYYRVQLGLSPTAILSGQCAVAKSPCGIFIQESLYTFSLFVWVYIAWSGLYVGTIVAFELRDRERRLAVAEGAAHEAQVSALRLQLNPHFLFNTLNTLSGLVAIGRKALAEEVILNLSNFMRYSLTGAPDQLIPLSKELEAQKLYLDIERVRFANRLVVSYDIAADAENACVPSFLLQPLVENAIKYAVAPSETEVTLRIAARKDGNNLVICVDNSPPSVGDESPGHGLGIGVANVRKRLNAVYGGRARLNAGPTEEGGWSNEVQLPWVSGDCDTNTRLDR